MNLSDAEGQVAELLYTAHLTRTAVPPIRSILGEGDIPSAYAVQAELTRRRCEAGESILGRKIGLTSEAVQQQLGVDQPDFGVLFDTMRVDDGGSLGAHALVQPKAEAEVAFLLGADLDGDLDRDTIRAAVRQVIPAIEIVDSRVKDWDITIVDTVADNGSSGAFVLGGVRRSIGEIEPKDVEMTLSVNGDPVSAGTGEACLGDPLAALAWLARTAQDFDDPLRSGQVILSGALGPMVAISPGDVVEATITGLGKVSFHVDKEAGA